MKNRFFFLPFFFTLMTINIFSNISNNKDLILKLNKIGAIKFENVTLEGGIVSPFYFDMRLIISYPDVLINFADAIKGKMENINCDVICGVPYAAVPVATLACANTKTPMIMQRKEPKSHGTKKMLEGNFKKQDKCLIIEDVIVTGNSIKKSAVILEDHDLIARDVIILIDREQGGVQRLEKEGFRVHTILQLSEVIQVLLEEKLITQAQVDIVRDFCANNKV